TTATAFTAFLLQGRHHHPYRQRTIARQCQVLPQELSVLGFSRFPRKPVLVAQHTSGRMAKVRLLAVEHEGSVSGQGGKPSQAIGRLRSEFAESVDQAEIHLPPNSCARARPAPKRGAVKAPAKTASRCPLHRCMKNAQDR